MVDGRTNDVDGLNISRNGKDELKKALDYEVSGNRNQGKPKALKCRRRRKSRLAEKEEYHEFRKRKCILLHANEVNPATFE